MAQGVVASYLNPIPLEKLGVVDRAVLFHLRQSVLKTVFSFRVFLPPWSIMSFGSARLAKETRLHGELQHGEIQRNTAKE